MEHEGVLQQGKRYARHINQQQGRFKIDPDLLIFLREMQWQQTRKSIGEEVQALMPLVLVPPPEQRSSGSAGTMIDYNRTRKTSKNEPLR